MIIIINIKFGCVVCECNYIYSRVFPELIGNNRLYTNRSCYFSVPTRVIKYVIEKKKGTNIIYLRQPM